MFAILASLAAHADLPTSFEWLPGQEPSVMTPKSVLAGLPRSTADRPDEVTGAQVHVIYMLPSDGVDESLDTNGKIATSVVAFNRWLVNNTPGRGLRIDTFQGLPDVTFFRMARSDAQIRALGAFVRDALEADLRAAGRIQSNKLYAVYYGGSSTWACGGGAYPPLLPGSVGAMYLKGEVAGAPPCANNPLGASLESPGYMEFAMLHELFHTLGHVPSCATNHTLQGHTSDNRNDLMYAGNQGWQLPPRLDINRDDYYNHGRANCLDFGASPYLTTMDGANFTNLWWNPAESGWGLNLNHQSDLVFATLFTYGADGQGLWLVASGLEKQGEGRYSGALYRTTGPAFNAVPWSAANVTAVGTMTLDFESTSRGSVSYSFNGTSITKAMELQVFSTPRPTCSPTAASRANAANYQDLWWNPAEPGWGINLTHQGNLMFATLFTYANDGRDLWLVASALTGSAGGFSGTLYRTTGSAFNASPWVPAVASAVGNMQLAFSNGSSGTLTYTFNGVTVTKPIQRQVFAARPTLCQ